MSAPSRRSGAASAQAGGRFLGDRNHNFSPSEQVQGRVGTPSPCGVSRGQSWRKMTSRPPKILSSADEAAEKLDINVTKRDAAGGNDTENRFFPFPSTRWSTSATARSRPRLRCSALWESSDTFIRVFTY
ncbi:unnamed protein product [Amoebophrya sp. A120]|nr:unnamed protein product [Amoebophrya sp. A120]|eukprot:GSA120T00001314001.1